MISIIDSKNFVKIKENIPDIKTVSKTKATLMEKTFPCLKSFEIFVSSSSL